MNKPIWCKTPQEILSEPPTEAGRQIANFSGFFALVIVIANVVDLLLEAFGVNS